MNFCNPFCEQCPKNLRTSHWAPSLTGSIPSPTVMLKTKPPTLEKVNNVQIIALFSKYYIWDMLFYKYIKIILTEGITNEQQQRHSIFSKRQIPFKRSSLIFKVFSIDFPYKNGRENLIMFKNPILKTYLQISEKNAYIVSYFFV
jgi:hypothetical protein